MLRNEHLTPVVLGSLVAALLLVTVTFAIARLRGRYDTIDTVWGVGFVVVAVYGLAVRGSPDLTPVLITVLTAIWGTRLSVHLHRRNRTGPEDPRYHSLLVRARRYPATRMFVRVYLVQALILWFVALPIQAGHASPGPDRIGPLAMAGIAVWTVGFAFETLGDEQLRRFRLDPANAGAVLTHGLWRYTRHPNYFGDCCVWWGVYLIAFHTWPGPLTVCSPLLMTWLLARGTGTPLLEKHLHNTRPAYADYVARTSGFFPLPPKQR